MYFRSIFVQLKDFVADSKIILISAKPTLPSFGVTLLNVNREKIEPFFFNEKVNYLGGRKKIHRVKDPLNCINTP